MPPHKIGPRAEYRQSEDKRIKETPSLAEKFTQLKSLTLDLAFYNPGGVTKSSQIKYTVNLANARSALTFSCLNNECVRGDFDLSEELAQAVKSKRKSVSGEKICQGSRNRASIGTALCLNILRYKFTMGY